MEKLCPFQDNKLCVESRCMAYVVDYSSNCKVIKAGMKKSVPAKLVWCSLCGEDTAHAVPLTEKELEVIKGADNGKYL